MVEFNRPDLRERVRIGLRVAEQFGLDVSETLQLTIPVADMVTPNLFTGYPKGAWGRVSVNAPGVGDSALCIIQSVPDRGIVYHVTQLWVTEPLTTSNIRIRTGNASVAGLTGFSVGTTKVFTDTRDQGIPNCQLAGAGPLLAGVPGAQAQTYNVTGEGWAGVIDVDVVLGGLGFLLVENLTTNENLDVSFRWTEYLLEDR